MGRLTRKDHASRDAMRRYGRRGVARCVLEHAGDDRYFEAHEVATEYRDTYGTAKLERWAGERNPVGGTGMSLVGMAVDRQHPKAARWP